MDSEKEYLTDIVRQSLTLAKKTLDGLGEAGVAEVDSKDIISTMGDITISQALIDFFKEQDLPAILFTEESGKIELSENHYYTITLDDLDGTHNYHHGKGFLPYCSIVSIFESIKPNFENALIAGIIEHNSGNIWIAIRGNGCFLNDEQVHVSERDILDEKTAVFIDDSHYKSKNYFKKIRAKGWVKNFGCSGIQLALISSGAFDGYINPQQKAHEIGAGYLLIKEAGGFMSDFNGNPLAKQEYNFNARYQIVAAATEELGRTLLSKLD